MPTPLCGPQQAQIECVPFRLGRNGERECGRTRTVVGAWIVQQAACIVGQLGKLMAVAPCSSTRCGEDVGLSGRCGELLAAAQRVAAVCMVVCGILVQHMSLSIGAHHL